MTKRRTWKRPLWCAAIAIIVFEIIYAFVVLTLVRKWEDRGAFGEMFGGLNALFAGFALAGVVYTIYLQIQETRASREEQAESLRAVQEQVGLLRTDIELQRRRDRVEAGPFFKLLSNSRGGQRLDLKFENTGAPIVCRDFKSTTAGCRVVSWHPSTLPLGETFVAPCDVNDPQMKLFLFEMDFRDRAGEMRHFELQLDQRSGIGMLDFWEKPT
jgi:hypothetical protein